MWECLGGGEACPCAPEVVSLCPRDLNCLRSLGRFSGYGTSCHPSRGESDLMTLKTKKVLVFESIWKIFFVYLLCTRC